MHLPRVRIGLEDFQRFAARHGDLLRLRAGEVAVDGMRDAAAPLQGEVVQMHDRRRTGQRVFFLLNNGGRADWRTISKTTNAGRRLRTDSYRLQSYDFNDQYRFFDTSSEGV